VEEFCSRALIEWCVRKDGTGNADLPGDCVRRHWDERGVSRQSKGLNRVQGRMTVGEATPQSRREGGTWRCIRSSGHKVKQARRGEELNVLWEGLWCLLTLFPLGMCNRLKAACLRYSTVQ
jgi:hypothetical protein